MKSSRLKKIMMSSILAAAFTAQVAVAAPVTVDVAVSKYISAFTKRNATLEIDMNTFRAGFMNTFMSITDPKSKIKWKDLVQTLTEKIDEFHAKFIAPYEKDSVTRGNSEQAAALTMMKKIYADYVEVVELLATYIGISNAQALMYYAPLGVKLRYTYGHLRPADAPHMSEADSLKALKIRLQCQ